MVIGRMLIHGVLMIFLVKTTHVTINDQVIADNITACAGLTVNAGASLTINSSKTVSCPGTVELLSDNSNSASLLGNGIYAENITYKRYLSGAKWHLISSPVGGQTISSFLTNTDNSISLSGSNYAMMDYNTTGDEWNSYFTSDVSGNFGVGNGYCLRLDGNGVIKFEGACTNTNVEVAVSGNGNGWNLIGNPYSSAINATSATELTNFLTINASKLDESYVAMYLWDEADGYDGSSNHYKIINNAGSGSLTQNYIQVGQGFFVKAATTTTVNFTPEMQNHQATVPLKNGDSPWPCITLVAEGDNNLSDTKIFFHETMGTGLDVGYDAGLLSDNINLDFYSWLVENNGVKFAIQCLPLLNEGSQTIPLGITSLPNKTIEIKAEKLDFPDNVSVVLEDKFENRMVELGSGQVYSIVTTDLDDEGRLYLHIGTNTTSSKGINDNLYTVIAFPSNNKIILKGPFVHKTKAAIYNLLGQQVALVDIHHGTTNDIFLHLKDGVYIIYFEQEDFVFRKKINWFPAVN